MTHYDEGRRACLKEYPEFFYADDGFEFVYNREWDMLSRELANQVEHLMEQGEWEQAAAILKQYRSGAKKDSVLEKLGIMSDIKQAETHAGVSPSFFDNLSSYSQMEEKYTAVRFLLFRMELGLPESEYAKLVSAIAEGSLSCEAVTQFVLHAAADRKAVLVKIKEIYRKAGAKEKEVRMDKLYAVIKDKPVPVAHTRKNGMENGGKE
jgi:Asp-tRNA(Asn)/Glu-tRNA(Gln) amidotransferase B subunit